MNNNSNKNTNIDNNIKNDSGTLHRNVIQWKMTEHHTMELNENKL